ncbi:bactoprenol glucosyl transferase [Burkholderia territorii]|uniref:Bactoprenol glucosyl transferase n=1 Tax=Burkholderia territorii TaxID=1503055 RepID=A0A108EVF1_9BURK|nr:glycosyltransferase family 2 protein [Burkholderia territorii]AOI67717.1 bactoprenol glucosyl transferase [Burkholderia territorii]KVG60077.1 bactoprenol glucosyl transferase [Burkholderia territorii]KVL01662.1 bactoprenol glucosyl transferase [Burkholderia territorii]KVL29061.1 bactoprenol glucosyl transferase [Burkholderia territorii]KVL53414.1 bactoprenol glucosyl transferase [Burkholderia territorii]
MREPLYTPLVSLVVPFYNEGEAVERFFDVVIPLMAGLDALRFEIVCVNDGSRDDTLERLIRVSMTDRRVRVIDLTRNFGKEAALTAGLDEAAGDAVIPLDADLQDPPSLIPVMLEHWRDGAEVVAAKRSNRACDSFAKRTAAAIYYRVHNMLSDVKLPENVGDFRLMDRKVVNALRSLPERHRFMKGLFAWVGYQTVIIEYQREARSAGHSKFSGWKLWNFALEGITSFSTVPLRSWTYIGLGIAALAFLYGAFIVGRTLLFGNPVLGYPSLLSVTLFIGGIELIGIGVVGEYIGRIYDESKQRPVYLIRRRYQTHAKVIELPIARDARRPNARRRAQPARVRVGAR